MMLVIFFVLAISLIIGWFGRPTIAIFLIIICLSLAVKQFLWEIYSPEYGFRMPWIQTRIIDQPWQRQFSFAFVTNQEPHGEAA